MNNDPLYSQRMVLFRPRTAVNLNDVVQVYGASNYCIIRFLDGRQLVIGITLHRIATRLPELVRIHKKHLVNLAHVSSVYQNEFALKLTTGEMLPVARRRKHQIQQRFNEYQSHA